MNLAPLIAALIIVESGGDPNCVADGGKSKGILCISRAYWQDGCEELKVTWDYDTDVWDVEKSKAVTVGYFRRYGRNYTRVTGKKPTYEVYARLHVGGPLGYRKAATEPYWHKVKSHLKEGE